MNKCVEYLAFVDAKTGKIKERFELVVDGKEPLEGRRSQLIKKLIGYSISERWIKPYQLFAYLKKRKYITIIDLLRYAYSDEE